MFARSFDLRTVRPTTSPRLSVRGILDRLVAYDALYRQRRALESLDDRMLQDIGVNRAEVEEEIRRPMPF